MTDYFRTPYEIPVLPLEIEMSFSKRELLIKEFPLLSTESLLYRFYCSDKKEEKIHSINELYKRYWAFCP